MSRIFLFTGVIAIVALVIIASDRLVATPSRASTIKIEFVNYIQSGMPEQDVFIEPDSVRAEKQPALNVTFLPCNPSAQFPPGSLRPWMLPPPLSDPCAKRVDVVRAEPQDALRPTMLSKQLYSASKVIPHDPYSMGPSPLGPFPQGNALGFTWREWLAARGSGTYILSNGRAQVDLSFTNLIPNATYSLWCGRDTRLPDYTSFEAACGTADGSQNKFHVDAAGKASLHLQLKPLLASSSEAKTVLLLSYDRLVPYTDEELGGYGFSNHAQLFFTFP